MHGLSLDTMDLAEEMAALGLPTSFVSRFEVHDKSTKECLNVKPDKKEGVEDVDIYDEEDAKAEPSLLFSVRSVKLYTANYIPPQEINLDSLEGLEYDCGAAEAGISFESEENDQDCEQSEPELPWKGEDYTADQANVQAQAGEVTSNGMIWEPVWDEQYQRYYFCNTQTWESSWDPPPGYEHYGSSPVTSVEFSGTDQSYRASCSEISSVGPDSTKSVNGSCNFLSTEVQGSFLEHVHALVEYARDSSAVSLQQENLIEPDECQKTSTLKTSSFNCYQGHDLPERPSSPDMVMEGGDESVEPQQISSILSAGPAKLTAVHRLEEVTCVDLVDEISTVIKAEDQFMDGVSVFSRGCGVHTIFCDSDDSSLGAVDNDGINWEEIEEPESATRESDGRHDETEGCSPSLESAAFVDTELTIRLSRERIKRRRVKGSSKSEDLEKVLLPGMAEMMSKSLIKYWLQRYSLFSRYDEGVKLDEEGWFSVTPETIAEHQARRCPVGLIIDAFSGVGGNAIQFALKKNHVIAIDIDPERLELARHNAEIYGVSDRIEFVVGDFFLLAPSLKADLVFLSPPWGGPEYRNQEKYDIQTMLQPKDGLTLFKTALTIAPNVALFLPRNVDLIQLKELAWLSSPPLPCEVERNYVDNRLKAVTAYYGDVALETSE